MYMVQAIINIDEHTNRVLNILKAKYDLKNKSSAIELMALQYEEEILEPELKPEYVDKARKTPALEDDPAWSEPLDWGVKTDASKVDEYLYE
jgi:hypothetical protein